MVSRNFLKQEMYTLDNFHFKCGEVLDNVDMEYVTIGTPNYDENGNIDNLIVISHGLMGTMDLAHLFDSLFEKGAPFDKEKYFFVVMTPLSYPNSCSPSNTGLGKDFPPIDLEDFANFKRDFLKAKFNVTKIKGIIGISLGGFVALDWASRFPDDVEFVISISSSCKIFGQKYLMIRRIQEIINSDPYYNGEDFQDLTIRTLSLIASGIYSHRYSTDFINNCSNEFLDLKLEDPDENFLFIDIDDVKHIIDAVADFDISDNIHNIKAKTLVVGVNQDQFIRPKYDSKLWLDSIKYSKLVLFDSELGHDGVYEISKIKDDLQEFMDSID